MGSASKSALPAPLLIPALFWSAGIILARFVFPDTSSSLIIIWIAILLAALVLPRIRTPLLLVLILLLGMFRYQVPQPRSMLDKVFTGRHHILQPAGFYVLERTSTESNSYVIELHSLADVPLRERILLNATQKLLPGKYYNGTLEILPIRQDPVLDTYTRKYPARAFQLHSFTEVHTQPLSKLPLSYRIRLQGLAALSDKLGNNAALAKALVFGDTASKRQWNQKLDRTGLVHLIVVSGLHVWFIYLILVVVFNLFLPRKLAELLFMILITIYAALNHWSAPVTRAVLMIFLFILARWLGRRVSRVQVLALSFFIITVISPRELFSIGLQLSFVAVAIIFFAVPHLYPAREEEGKRSLMLSFALRQVNYLLLSLFVGIGLFPLLSYHFGKASLNGILGNLIGVPLMAMLVPLSFLLIFVPAGNLLFTALANTYNLLHGIFDAWVSFIARLPLYAENLYFLPWQLLLLSTAILCFYLLVNKRFSWIKYTLGSSALLAGIILISGFLSKELKVYVFDAGVADCTLVQTPSGEMIMIDTGQGYPRLAPSGDRQYDSWMQRRLLSWLKRRRIESIDHLVLTHMHQDHYGGLPALATELKINRIYVSDETQAHPLWKTWQAEGMFSATLIHTISDTITYQLRDVRLKFLHPDSLHYSTSENDRSLVFRMDYGHTSYLFTGDIEADAEQYILSRYAGELKADYLKVPHHGSKTSSTPAFIRTVLPREAWITSSARNKHGFPHKESIETLTRYDAQVHITHSGSILHTRSATQKRIDKRAVHGKFWRTKE